MTFEFNALSFPLSLSHSCFPRFAFFFLFIAIDGKCDFLTPCLHDFFSFLFFKKVVHQKNREAESSSAPFLFQKTELQMLIAFVHAILSAKNRFRLYPFFSSSLLFFRLLFSFSFSLVLLFFSFFSPSSFCDYQFSYFFVHIFDESSSGTFVTSERIS